MATKLAGQLKEKRNSFLKVFVLLITGLGTLVAILSPLTSRPVVFQVQPGSVASQDYQAPRTITYNSKFLTDQKIETITSTITPLYLPIDPAITRHQIDKLRKALDFISLTRSDPYSDLSQKIDDISKIADMLLSREIATKLITLDEPTWQDIQRESISVLEQVMKASIRETQISENQVRIPSLISYTINEENSLIIKSLTAPFVVANSLFSESSTNLAIEEAIKNVEPVEKSYAIGEIIVRRGQIIDPVAFEALTQLGLISPKDQGKEFASATLFVVVISLLTGTYFFKRKNIEETLRKVIILSITFLIFLFAAKFLIPNRTILPYIFPLAGFTFAISALFDFEISALLSLILAAVIAFGTQNLQSLMLFYLIPAYFGALILGTGRRVSIFFLAGTVTGIVGIIVILSLRLFEGTTDLIGLITLSLASLINGMASASLGLLLHFIIAQILGITTAIQLLDLARPDHPLLQKILTNSPGSYQHSLQVSNLAEQAAKYIGADQLLTRVGAIYHDAGKSTNPSFFIENQVTGELNSHDDLDPYLSAATVIQHVSDGIELAKKYRLPSRIIDFIREHHGTLTTRYFYVKAVEDNNNDIGSIDEQLFRYPGPKPQSKETAILMLADGVEARARAEKPQNREELMRIAQKVIDFCQKEGQLEDTELTMRDLNKIVISFTDTLINTYHPRIKYPELSSQPKV